SDVCSSDLLRRSPPRSRSCSPTTASTSTASSCRATAAGRSSRRRAARPRPAVHCSPPAELRTARPPPSPTPRRRPCLPGVVAQGRVDALGPMQQQRQGKGPYDLLDGPPTSTTRQGELSASHECSEGPAPTRLSGRGPGAPLRITVTG